MKKPFPHKLFYKIGEVSELTALEPYVLRYWEGEFGLKLTKSKNSQRLYQRKDIDQILRIKQLLYEEKFTIAGAKKKIRERKRPENHAQLSLLGVAEKVPVKPSKNTQDAFIALRREVESLLETVENFSSHAS